jgi:hypothetical protein
VGGSTTAAGGAAGTESGTGGAGQGEGVGAGGSAGGSAGATAGGAGAGAAAGQAGSGGTSTDEPDPEKPAGWVPALIGVGYGGIRIVSRDGGAAWGERSSFSADGGDDFNLLRAVVYGKGKWIATGWKLVTSNDGKSWTDHGMINDNDFMPCNIIEGLAYADGWFYAACSGNPSVTFRSSDGLEWQEFGTIGQTDGHLFLTYRSGKFVAYGDNARSFESNDGKTFSEMSGIESATFCEGTWKSEQACFEAAWFDGVYLRTEWQGKIARSTTGSGWEKAYEDDELNTLYRSRAITAGYVAP